MLSVSSQPFLSSHCHRHICAAGPRQRLDFTFTISLATDARSSSDEASAAAGRAVATMSQPAPPWSAPSTIAAADAGATSISLKISLSRLFTRFLTTAPPTRLPTERPILGPGLPFGVAEINRSRSSALVPVLRPLVRTCLKSAGRRIRLSAGSPIVRRLRTRL